MLFVCLQCRFSVTAGVLSAHTQWFLCESACLYFMLVYIRDWRSQWEVEEGSLLELRKYMNKYIEKIKIFIVQSLLFKFSTVIRRRLYHTQPLAVASVCDYKSKTSLNSLHYC